MKKFIAVVLAVVCIFSVFCIGVYAADGISPQEDVKIISGITGGKGTVTPPSSSYKPGDDVTFHITPDKGYRIKQVWVNGVAVGPVSEYEFKNIQADSTIYAEFEKISDATTKPVKRNEGKTSPNTGAEFGNTFVLCVLGVAVIGGIAAVSVSRKGRREEY